MNLNKFSFISKNKKLNDAIKHLNKNKLHGIVLVTDKHKKLQGTITDGDVRRAIIKKINLNSDLSFIMNKKPITIDESQLFNSNKIKNLFKKFRIKHLVVLNKRKVKKVILYDEISESSLSNIPVVIMAGGEGKRLRPITNNIPKPLIKIGKETIVSKILKYLSSSGFKKIYIIVNYLSSKIIKSLGNGEKFGLEIKYIKEKKKLGTIGGLSLLKNFNYENFVLVNADILTNLDYKELIKQHIKNNSDFTVSTVNYSYEIPYGIIDRKLDKLHKMIEKPTYNYDINAGIYVLNTKILKFIKKNKYADIDHLINLLIKRKLKSFIFPIYEHWFEIGRKKHLKNLSEKFSYE
tara:strand:- start:436 stop:1485 length:1050 start_codon:yes stop_codon:yes gene_type:complete